MANIYSIGMEKGIVPPPPRFDRNDFPEYLIKDFQIRNFLEQKCLRYTFSCKALKVTKTNVFISRLQ